MKKNKESEITLSETKATSTQTPSLSYFISIKLS